MTDFRDQGAQHGARKRRALSNATASSLPTHRPAADTLGQGQFLLGLNGDPTSPGAASFMPQAISATAGPVLRGSNAFLSAQAFSQEPTLDFDSDLGTNIDFSGNLSTHPLPDNNAIQRYTSEDPAPWNPVNVAGVSPTTTQKNVRQRNFPDRLLSVQHPKTSGSESGTQMDSGYYSNPAQSHIETQSVNSGTIGDLAVGQQACYRDASAYHQHPSPQNSASDISPQGPELIPAMQSPGCPELGCTWVSKSHSQSELKKHKARHTSDHICHIANCPRAGKGFASINDLDRHTRSVHKQTEGCGFKCFAPGCSKPDKLWPRRDNFKHHLESIHPNTDTAELIRLAEESFERQKSAATRQRASESGESAQNRRGTSSEPRPSQTSTTQPFNLLGASQVPRSLGPVPSQVPGLMTPRPPQSGQRGQLATPRNPGSASKNNKYACIVPRCRVAPFSSLHYLNRHYFQEHQEEVMNNLTNSTVAPNMVQNFDLSFQPSRQALDMFSHNVFDYDGRANTIPDPQNVQARLEDLASPMDPPNTDFMPADFLLAQIAPNLDPKTSFTGDEAQQAGYLESNSAINIPCEGEQSQELSAEKIKGFLETYTRKNGGDGPIISEAHLMEALKSTLRTLCSSTPIGSAGSQSAQLTGTEASQKIKTYVRDGKTWFCCPDTLKDGTHCPKSMTPQSALTKHRKRHARPYGCTFDTCYLRFGSKNDWKRHELTRHIQQECWICPGSKSPSAMPDCQTLFYNSTEFTEHLRLMHSISDNLFPGYLQRRRLGRGWVNSYWCGFCRAIQQTAENGDDGNTERFNHIDDHFTGREKRTKYGIEDWMPPEGADLKGVREEKDKKNSLVPKENKDESSSDDEAEIDENNDGRQASSSPLPPREPGSTALKRTASTAFLSSLSLSEASSHALARSHSANVSPGGASVHEQSHQSEQQQHHHHHPHNRQRAPPRRRAAEFRKCCWCNESTLLALAAPQCQCHHFFCSTCTFRQPEIPANEKGD